jgi:hypothetical protein
MGAKAFLLGLGIGLGVLGGAKAYERHLDRQMAAAEAAGNAALERARALSAEFERSHPPYKTTSTTAGSLERMLEQVPHTYRADFGGQEAQYSEAPAEVQRLTPAQRTKVYQLLHALQHDRKLRQSIGKTIESDLNDKKTELGGIIAYDGLALRLQEHYPAAFVAGDGNNNYHDPPSRKDAALHPDYFADFHLHATGDDDTAFAGPSPPDLVWVGCNMHGRTDSCGVVITKLKGKQFNVDLYFAPAAPDSVIQAGAMTYDEFLQFLPDCRIVDLGNYSWE